MKPRRDKHAQPASVQPAPAAAPTWQERLRGMIAILAVGLALTAPLVPSEGAIREGTYAVLATCWCLLLLGWTALAFWKPGSPLRFGWTEVAGGLFILWHSLCALAWLGHGHDRQTLNALWLIVGYGLTVFVLRQVVGSAQRARVLIALMLWLAATLAATGYVQYFVTMPALRAEYLRNPKRMLKEQGISTDANSAERQLFENRLLHSFEPLATYSTPNSLAGFLAPWLIVAIAIGLASLRDRANRRAVIGAACLSAFLAGCLLLTKSRTAWLAAMAGVPLLAIYGRGGGGVTRWIGWKVPLAATGVLVVIGLAVVYVGGLDAEVLSEAPKSVLYRLEYWRSTAAMIANQPLWGCGPGGFQQTFAAYKLPQASEMVADPHNFLLEIWALAGTPAILLLLATAVALAADLSRIAIRSPDRSSPASQFVGEQPAKASVLFFGGGITALVLGFLFAALGDFPLDTLGDMPIPVVWWVGGPLLPVVWWLLQPWTERGALSVGAVIVALLVLAINLLAAGAVVFPGVVVTALVIVPVAMPLGSGLAMVPSAKLPAARGSWWAQLPTETRLSRAVAGGLWAAAFALAIACLWTEYQPVLNSRLQMRIAMGHLQPRDTAAAQRAAHAAALRSARAAAAADPWSPDPWRLIAELHFQQFLAELDAELWTQFTAAAEEFRRRNPRYHGQFFQRGNWYFLAWQRCQEVRGPDVHAIRSLREPQSARLAEALASYREAINRYPHHALYHGQLAWALAAAGDLSAAREAAERAQALDDAMPHTDQKLARQRIADWQPRAATQVRPETAEQTLKNLGKTNAR